MRGRITQVFFMACMLLIFPVLLYAQDIQVTGKVTAKSDGAPLPGVSVTVKGTTRGTSTDASGNFRITAPTGAVLMFRQVGMTDQSVTVSNSTPLSVILTDNVKNLDEVVVVGYGTQKKSDVTGAISSVKTKDFQDQQVLNVTDVLKGRVSGVTAVQTSGAPGSAATIRVRGITSINNSDPLYVIDGITVLNGGIENINPNDIQSIEVLKDASAAIYGSRASAGVVLVTTKKGRSGDPQLTYNGYIGTQNPVKHFDLANATEYATLRNLAVTNDGGNAPFANPSQYGEGTDWQDQIFEKNAMIQNHGLAVSGGSDKSTYYTSFGYTNQQGIIFPSVSNYKRYNFAANTNFKVKKWINIGENFQYAYSKNQGGVNTNSEFGGPLSSALNLDPITPVVITGTVPSTGYTNPYIVRDPQGRPYGISQYVGQEMTNPVAWLQTVQGNYSWSHNILGNAFVEIMPVKGLTLKTQANGKQAFYGGQSFSPLYYLNSQSNNTSNVNENRSANRNFTWNWDNTALYEQKIDKHSYSVLVGFTAQEQQGVTLSGQYNNLPNMTYEQASFNYALANANRIATSGEDQPYHTASYFSRLNYSYDGKYLFTGIFRRDGSSRFGSNNVWGNFPGAELGWVISQENFMKSINFINFLKLRGSYGVIGNEQSLTPFQYIPIVAGGRNYVFGNDQITIGNSITSPANPNLKWEEVHTSNVGFDAVLLSNFNLTVDLYRKLTKGMLQGVPLPSYNGWDALYFDNVGNLENKGVEVSLGYNKTFGQVRFSGSGNISYNKNEVTYLGSTAYYDTGSFQNSSYSIFRTQVGQPVSSFYGFHELGTFKSQAEIDSYVGANGQKIQPNARPGDLKWEDTNGDGSIGQDDRQFLGSQLPKWNYGINLHAEYKGFDATIFGQGAWDNLLYQGYRRLDIAAANYPAEALNSWTTQNASSNYPRLTASDPNHNFSNPSNFNLQSGAYFRIKTAQIGYTLPKNLLNKIDVNRIRVYISSNNLATITKYNGFDPEIGGDNNARGIDRGIYPQARSFLFGLDLTL
ncbi:SusC/RagA family TonB-linked outer membrane protein [Pedobacter sp. HMF7647]|uniref:SusC/RagA family TonB-linked outer membrane protein n=1 Tax=Hufsiella arboris TaxID=2695275 RepID=A0A7K1Y7W0_9SPHI|nr:TonB-dependent receptor [Hufsiella arboris]MXV50148.1 SusC/RagA family TonB-linked outer membrane protein [Hufsiella arboris]